MDTITVTISVDYQPKGYEVDSHKMALGLVAKEVEKAAGRIARRHVLGEITVKAEVKCG